MSEADLEEPVRWARHRPDMAQLDSSASDNLKYSCAKQACNLRIGLFTRGVTASQTTLRGNRRTDNSGERFNVPLPNFNDLAGDHLSKDSATSLAQMSKITTNCLEMDDSQSLLRWRDSECSCIVLSWPDSILPGGQNAVRVKCVLDHAVEMHLRIIVKIVCFRDLIHERQVRSVLAPTMTCCIIDKRGNQNVGATARIRVLAIKNKTDNVVHLSHPHDESADEVKPGFFTSCARQFILTDGIVSTNLGDGREEEVGTVGKPVPESWSAW